MKRIFGLWLSLAVVLSLPGAAGVATAMMLSGSNFQIFSGHLAIPGGTRVTLTESAVPGIYDGMLGGQAVKVALEENSRNEYFMAFGDLDSDRYRIELTEVVSRYVDETEKNLEHLFNTRGDSYVILFFDDADALFGSRSPFSSGIPAPVPAGLSLSGPLLLGLMVWRTRRVRRGNSFPRRFRDSL